MSTWVQADRPIPTVKDLGVPVFEVTLPNRPIVRSEIRSEIRDEGGELIRRRSGLVSHPKQIPTSPQRGPKPVFTLRKPRKDQGKKR